MAKVPAAVIGADEKQLAPARSWVLWALAGVTAIGVAIRFASLGLQSYHHDEVITVMRVIPGSFIHMLHEVKISESNPPLYYVLAWVWAKAFGTGEFGIRSLSALFGAATVPVAYLIGRELSGARAGLIGAALVAVNPMLIWYSQEARSYALLVFFCAASMLFFLRALRRGGESRDLALWALSSALALCSHYFAVFPVVIEAAWMLVAMRSRWRLVLPAIAAVGVVGLALIPLIAAQTNPHHIGWIEQTPLSKRLFETGSSFLIGETGHVIAEPPRHRYALIPAILLGVALLLVALRGSRRQRRAAALAAVIGLGTVAGAILAALLGKDYIVERNLLPTLIPLGMVAAVGFAAKGARRAGALCAIALCAYWLAFDIHVTQTPNLQRPNFRELAQRIGPLHWPRAIVTWRLAADPLVYYLHHGAERIFSGETPIREIDVVSKPIAAKSLHRPPPGFRPVQQIRAERLTLTRYMSPQPRVVPFYKLRKLNTGFGRNAVVVESQPIPAGGTR